jgi:hypothetical protein
MRFFVCQETKIVREFGSGGKSPKTNNHQITYYYLLWTESGWLEALRDKRGVKTRSLSTSAGRKTFFVVLVLFGFSGVDLKSIPQK